MFLIALRQANVWIVPTARQAPDQTTNETVRAAAKELFDSHARLDVDILKAAADVGVVLPNDPSNEQQKQIVELGNRTGTDHDRAFATSIRAAQGTLLVQGAHIRATTRNSAMRTLAHLTVHTLLRGMQTLETTGLVDQKAFQLNAKKAEVNSVRIIADNVDPADRELYVKLRQDTLWQAPISREAADRGSADRVRTVSDRVAGEHTTLSQKIYDLAAKSGVALPGEPTAEQKSWANAISKSSGPELDRTYANLVRAADGSLITFVAQSRATTRDNAVRDLAQSSLDQLLNQMTLLESTGLVRSDSLSAAAPATETKANTPSRSPAEEASHNGVLTGIIVLIVAAAGTLWLVRAIGHHGEHRR